MPAWRIQWQSNHHLLQAQATDVYKGGVKRVGARGLVKTEQRRKIGADDVPTQTTQNIWLLFKEVKGSFGLFTSAFLLHYGPSTLAEKPN